MPVPFQVPVNSGVRITADSYNSILPQRVTLDWDDGYSAVFQTDGYAGDPGYQRFGDTVHSSAQSGGTLTIEHKPNGGSWTESPTAVHVDSSGDTEEADGSDPTGSEWDESIILFSQIPN